MLIRAAVWPAPDWASCPLARVSGSEAGKGGPITFKDSSWLLTIVLNHQPHFREQPAGTFVWWGYALFPGKDGDFVRKPMSACTGREILDEVLQHLGFTQSQQILDASIVIPALMPYITSQFLVRAPRLTGPPPRRCHLRRRSRPLCDPHDR
jgi:oleate hydratase